MSQRKSHCSNCSKWPCSFSLIKTSCQVSTTHLHMLNIGFETICDVTNHGCRPRLFKLTFKLSASPVNMKVIVCTYISEVRRRKTLFFLPFVLSFFLSCLIFFLVFSLLHCCHFSLLGCSSVTESEHLVRPRLVCSCSLLPLQAMCSCHNKDQRGWTYTIVDFLENGRRRGKTLVA